MKDSTQQKIIEEFEKQFAGLIRVIEPVITKWLKSFLKKSIDTAYLAGRRDVLGELVEKMPKEVEYTKYQKEFGGEDASEIYGFNKCRDAILSLISEMKK